MKGFTDKGILLFPREESYDALSETQRVLMTRTVRKLITFFKQNDIQLECFYTDDVAKYLTLEGLDFVIPATQEDLFFLTSGKVSGYEGKPMGKPIGTYDNDARRKYPTSKGMEDKDRFGILVKRDKFIANKHISNSRLVITFERKSKAYYKTETKEMDNRLLLRVDPSSFVVSTTFSGQDIDPTFILEYKKANLPVPMWEVEEWRG